MPTRCGAMQLRYARRKPSSRWQGRSQMLMRINDWAHPTPSLPAFLWHAMHKGALAATSKGAVVSNTTTWTRPPIATSMHSTRCVVAMACSLCKSTPRPASSWTTGPTVTTTSWCGKGAHLGLATQPAPIRAVWRRLPGSDHAHCPQSPENCLSSDSTRPWGAQRATGPSDYDQLLRCAVAQRHRHHIPSEEESGPSSDSHGNMVDNAATPLPLNRVPTRRTLRDSKAKTPSKRYQARAICSNSLGTNRSQRYNTRTKRINAG